MIVVLEVVVVPENVLVLAVLGGIRNFSISAPGRTLQTQPLLPCQSSEHFRSFGLPGAVLRSCGCWDFDRGVWQATCFVAVSVNFPSQSLRKVFLPYLRNHLRTKDELIRVAAAS